MASTSPSAAGAGEVRQLRAGAVLDVVVDIRVGSPTYGRWDGVELDDVDRRAVYLAEGLGHVFVALTDDATVTYLCSTPYAPGREHGVHPLDPAIGLELPPGVEPLISPKDADAPTLELARTQGLLPSWAECQRWYEGHALANRRYASLCSLPTALLVTGPESGAVKAGFVGLGEQRSALPRLACHRSWSRRRLTRRELRRW